VDFRLSAEQALIKDSVERFILEQYGSEQRAQQTRDGLGFNPAHWATFAELGWLGLPVPEERGGFGGGAVETMIVMEAFGAGLVATPFVPSVVMASALLAAAKSESADALLAAALAGRHILTIAYAEPTGGYDPANVATRAERDGDDFIITGRKIAVPYAAAAGTAIVSTRTGHPTGEHAGVTLLAVALDAPGIERRDYVTYDDRRASDLDFAGVRIPADAALGDTGAGLPLLEDALDRGIAAICAEAAGAMSVLLKQTTAYLRSREQFGRPIGTFQVLQHRAVDMLVHLELARAMATDVAAAIDAGDGSAHQAAAAAKVEVAACGRFVSEAAMQLHGAIGITDELEIGQYVKRITTIERELGDARYSLNRYMAAR
jgi:alkylation response protein AidB-like acyl-CoA dehydrogenase